MENARRFTLNAIFSIITIIFMAMPLYAADDKALEPIDTTVPPVIYYPLQIEGERIKEDKKDDDIVRIITNQISKEQTVIEAIAVNMDCFVLKRFLSQKKVETEEDIKVAKNKFFLSVYLHSLFLYSILDRINKDENCDTEIDPEDIIPLIFKPYSSFLLSSNMTGDYTS